MVLKINLVTIHKIADKVIGQTSKHFAFLFIEREERVKYFSRRITFKCVSFYDNLFQQSHKKVQMHLMDFREFDLHFSFKTNRQKKIEMLHMFLEWKILHQFEKLDHENHIIIWSSWPFFDELWSSTCLSTFILFHYYIKPEHKFDLRSYETFKI